MKFSFESMVQRRHNYAIVDEIDSCLIDEARTPLIISGATEDKSDKYFACDKLIKELDSGDYEIDEKSKSVNLTDKGVEEMEKVLLKEKVLKNNNLFKLF